jgi:hypothetical protein
MGIKSFFRNLGRSIKRGFNNFVAGAGDVVGGAATVLQRKVIPGIASGATKAAGLLDKLAPAADAAGVGGEAAEASQVLGKVGDVTGKFAKFIGSDLPTKGTAMNEQQITNTLQSPLIAAFRRSSGQKPLDAAGAAALSANYSKTGSATLPAPAPAASSSFAKLSAAFKPGLISPAPAPMFKPGLLSPAPAPMFKPIGSNPASYSPKPSSGIEAPPPASNSKIAVVPGGGALQSMVM